MPIDVPTQATDERSLPTRFNRSLRERSLFVSYLFLSVGTLANWERSEQFITLHIEDAVEAGAIILKCDLRSQLQQLVSFTAIANIRLFERDVDYVGSA